jgi:HEAT repeat protein
VATQPAVEQRRPAAGAAALAPDKASELIGFLAKGIRARQTYNPNNPVYQKFVGALRAAFASAFDQVSELRVAVEENAFRIGEETVTLGEGRESLPFFFYKDGIRRLDFLPGFEDELELFLDVLHQARQAGPEGEDLVSLLWEHEFEAFNYSYVDLLAEGVTVPDPAQIELPSIPGGIVAAELAGLIDLTAAGESTADAEPSADPAAAAPSGLLAADDFKETLYFLDDDELESLRQELEREWARDLRRDVLYALFDRLEDGSPERQVEVLEVLHQLLPAFIVRGHLAAAAALLHELDGLLERQGLLGEEARQEASRLLEELNTPVVLEQLIQALEAADIDPESSDLSVFLSHLGAAALPALLRTAELTATNAVRLRLEPALAQLGSSHSAELLALLGSRDEVVAIGAARVAGRLRLPQAAAGLPALLARPSAAARLVAVEALIEIRSATAVKALQEVLEDPVREVRIAAARGLGTLRYQPARARFEEILEGRGIRDADLTEKLAFFEAYAALAGGDAIPLLERLLSGRGLLGRRHSPEIRACAATALGRIAAPSARAVLELAREETEPVVRGAILRALRQEASAS